MIFRVREPRGGGAQSPALKTPEPHSASTVWGTTIKQSPETTKNHASARPQTERK